MDSMVDQQMIWNMELDKLTPVNKNIKYSYTWVLQDIAVHFCDDYEYGPINYYTHSPYFTTNVEGELLKWDLAFECSRSCINLKLNCYSECSTEKSMSFGVKLIDNNDEIKTKYFTCYYNNKNKLKNYIYSIRLNDFGFSYDSDNFLLLFSKGMSLKIVCNIYFEVPTFCKFGCNTDNHHPFNNLLTDHALEELNNLEEFFESGKLSDMTIVASDQEFRVHKLILSLRSKVFSAMITHDMQEKSKNLIKIEDVDANVMREMLRFMYTEKVQDIDRLADDLLKVADRYDIQGLKDLCEKKLIEGVNLENFQETFAFADLYKAEKLKKYMIEFLSMQVLECRQIQEKCSK